MAFFTGTSNSLADLETAIGNALVASSWALNSGVFTKDNMAVRFVIDNVSLYTYFGTGRIGSAIENEGPYGFGITLYTAGTRVTRAIYPVTYNIFTYDTEIYVAVAYNGNDNFQWISFGVADQMPAGEGHYLTGSTSNRYSECKLENYVSLVITTSSGNSSFYASNPQANTTSYRYNDVRPPFIRESNTMIRASLGGAVRWFDPNPGPDNDRFYSGSATAQILVACAPGRDFLTNALAPINFGAYTDTTRLYCKYFGQLKYCRYTRTDFYTPGETMDFGQDVWSVWPIGRRLVGTNVATMVGLAMLEVT
jgi:hypothetical protein